MPEPPPFLALLISLLPFLALLAPLIIWLLLATIPAMAAPRRGAEARAEALLGDLVEVNAAVTPERLRDGAVWVLVARGAELFFPLDIIVRVRKPGAGWVAAGVARIDLPPPR